MHTVHRSRRTAALIFVLAACLTAAGGLVPATALGAPSRGSAPPDRAAGPPSAGASAAGWLGRQFKPDGDLPESQGEPGITYLPLAIVALASANVGRREIAGGIRYLELHFASYVEVPASKSRSVPAPGRLAELILAAVAAGKNPRRFGGDKPSNNLVARLLATQIKSGADKGLFGSPGGPTYSSAYTQGLALTALAAVGRADAPGAAWLVAQQCPDGGWESFRSDAKKCSAPDPKTYTGPDTNDTALAVEGLVAAKVSPKVNPLAFLEASQYSSGGFAYFGGHSSAQTPDPDSTALVAQALVALGKLSAVKRDGRGAEAGLAAFQLGCRAQPTERGAYRYPREAGANLYATIQAIPAAMRKAFPIPPGSASSSLPVLSCK